MADNGKRNLPGPIPIVDIELDKPRHLLFDFWALRCAEKQMLLDWGVKTSVTSVLGVDITITDLNTLLWAALQHEDKNLTIEQVGHLVHPKNLEYVADKVRDAFGLQAAADEEEDAQQDPPKP